MKINELLKTKYPLIQGGMANIAKEYATKRYRSNLINWGMLPFNIDEGTDFPYEPGDFIFVPGIRKAVLADAADVGAEEPSEEEVGPDDANAGRGVAPTIAAIISRQSPR